MSKSSNIFKMTLFIAAFTLANLQKCLHNQYFDSSTSQCVNCQKDCDQCKYISTNCTACVTAYYLVNSTCVGCPQQCYSCNSSSICTSCKQNYYMNKYSCFSCSKNCMFCTAKVCNSCQIGYDITNNCLSCSYQFFYNSSLNVCERCSLGCLDCKNKTYCFNCDKGYKIVNNMCQFIGMDQTSTEQPKNTDKDSQSSIFFIILGVLVTFIGISFIAFTIYYCFWSKLKNIKKQTDAQDPQFPNEQYNKTPKPDKDSLIEFQNQLCQICNQGVIEIANRCGHFFHIQCYYAQQKQCPVCQQDFSVAETYFQQPKNKQMLMQLYSEYPIQNSKHGKQQSDYHQDQDEKKVNLEIGNLK